MHMDWKGICSALAVTCFAVSASASAATMQEHCGDEWPNDAEMYNYCIKEQRLSKAAVSKAPQDEIATRCASEWPSEYDMQEHCAKERRSAKHNIELNYSGASRRACEREWGTEYEMVEYCISEKGE